MEPATRTEASNTSPAVVLLIIITLALCYSAVFTFLLTDTSGFSYLYLLMLIQVTPFAIAYITKKFTFLSFVMLVNFVTYSVSKFNQTLLIEKRTYLKDISIHAIECLVLTSLLIIFAYAVTTRFLAVKRFVGNYKLLSFRPWITVGLILLSISQYFLIDYVPNQVMTLYFMATGTSMVAVLCSRISKSLIFSTVVKLSITANGLYYFIETGSMSLLGYIIATFFMVSCLQKRLRNLVPLVLMVILMSAIQTVKADFRMQAATFLSNGRKPSIERRIEMLYELLQQKYFKTASEVWETEEFGVDSNPTLEKGDLLAHGFARVGDDSLERVLALTPEQIPFWDGETYEGILFMMIPRLFWPSKPTWGQWNKFGRTYGFISPDDYSTSVGVSFLGEGYMNYGYIGMYLCALFFGIVLAAIEKLSYQFLRGPYCFTFIFCLFPFLTPNSNLGPILNSILISIATLTILRKFLLRFVTQPLTA